MAKDKPCESSGNNVSFKEWYRQRFSKIIDHPQSMIYQYLLWTVTFGIGIPIWYVVTHYVWPTLPSSQGVVMFFRSLVDGSAPVAKASLLDKVRRVFPDSDFQVELRFSNPAIGKDDILNQLKEKFPGCTADGNSLVNRRIDKSVLNPVTEIITQQGWFRFVTVRFRVASHGDNHGITAEFHQGWSRLAGLFLFIPILGWLNLVFSFVRVKRFTNKTIRSKVKSGLEDIERTLLYDK